MLLRAAFKCDLLRLGCEEEEFNGIRVDRVVFNVGRGW